jgi:uncharacterized protein (TIGR03435 family)
MLKQITVFMAKRFAKTAAGLLMAAGVALGQAPKLEFEVASIKPAQAIAAQASSGKLHIGMQIDGARVDIGSMRLADLIPVAFKVKWYQVSGPDWLSSDIMSAPRFDVMGKMPEGATAEQVPAMLQALLADRFRMTFHRESREHAVYALVVAKGGPKLKESVPEPDAPAGGDSDKDDKKSIAVGTADGSQVRIKADSKGGMVTQGGQGGTTRITPGPDGSMRMEASKLSMALLAESLSRFVDRPILDMTELKGDYQVMLELSMADMMTAVRA